MIKKFTNKKFRNAFVASNVRRGIAYQLRALRGEKTQGQVGKMAGKPQNVISRLENPTYGKVRVQTLLELAASFDVALLVRFVPFSKLLAESKNLSQEVLAPLSFDKEIKSLEGATFYGDKSVVAKYWAQQLKSKPDKLPVPKVQAYSGKQVRVGADTQQANAQSIH